MNNPNDFGTKPISQLLREQAIPASVGMLIMSLYGIVDTIFVGRWVGPLEIGAITVVLPINFLLGAVGMSIGGGGGSVISRAFGEQNHAKAVKTFANQIVLTCALVLLACLFCWYFMEETLAFFGGKGNILAPSIEFFSILLIGLPFLAWSMMANHVIRAEGYPKVAMLTLIVPAVANTLLDPLFIIAFDMGLAGAAWATTISYIASAAYTIGFFLSAKSNMKPRISDFSLNWPIVREITAIGSVSFARQGTISLLAVVLNNSLFHYGGEHSITVYGIVSRVLTFANFPVIGISTGFLPIAGYNYGAKLWGRLDETVKKAILYGSAVSFLVFCLIMLSSPFLTYVFTDEPALLEDAPHAMRLMFLATPLLATQLVAAGYFQAIGKVTPALLLTLCKQGFFLIPLVILLPLLFGLDGIWVSFPLADLGTAGVSYYYLKKQRAKPMESIDGASQ